MSCKIRDKAQGPSAFISQPCKRLTSSTPELRAQLNLTKSTKKEVTTPGKHVLLPDFSWKKRWSQAQRHVVQPNDIRQGENRKMASCSLYLSELLIQKCKFRQKKRWSQAQRHVVQPNDIRQGENRKMASGSLYLDELPTQKCQFRDRFNVSIFCLERLSPRGSCHLDESSMNQTLAQKCLIGLLMWNASHVQKHSS